MKRILLFLSALVLASSICTAQVHVTTPNMSLVIKADKGSAAQYLYFGNRLSDADLSSLKASGAARQDICPAYGFNCPDEAALAMTHSDA
ncbi:MAG: hypothetical protein ACI4TU_02005 [Candidatus Cryptobacteroides sp.]